MVLGKKLPPQQNGQIDFQIAIPEKYAIIDKVGPVVGKLDGSPFDGSRFLPPGRHVLVEDSPTDSVVALWARAVEKGFSPFEKAQN